MHCLLIPSPDPDSAKFCWEYCLTYIGGVELDKEEDGVEEEEDEVDD